MMKIKEKWLSMSHPNKVLFVIIIISIIVIICMFFFKKNTVQSESVTLPKDVTIASIAELSMNQDALPLNGRVKSKTEATIRSETSGIIKKNYHKLGDYVKSGEMLMILDNSSQFANNSQSESIIAVAEANLKSTIEQQDLAVKTAYDNMLNSNIEAIPDDSEKDYVAPIISGNYNLGKEGIIKVHFYYSNGGVSFTVSGITQGTGMNNAITPQPIGNSGLYIKSSDNTRIEEEDWVINIPNKKASNYLSNYNAYQTAIKTRENAVLLAKANLNQAKAGQTISNIQLSKTIIYSPVSGTINSFNLNQGDLVSMGQEIAFVSDNKNLEIVTYVSENDKSDITIGGITKINNQYDGVITSIASAIDPNTNRIEVKISPVKEIPDLINGQSVNLKINRTSSNTASTGIKYLSIPLSALKVESDRMVVFTVDSSGKLVSFPVKDGPIIGDKIIISEIEPTIKIITDARGHKDGDVVTIKQ